MTTASNRSIQIPPGQPMIEVRGLIKRYGSLTAVDGIDLTVFSGEVFGILGPNGAGKTTTLEMIEGLRQPDAGAIAKACHARVVGVSAVPDGLRARIRGVSAGRPARVGRGAA